MKPFSTVAKPIFSSSKFCSLGILVMLLQTACTERPHPADAPPIAPRHDASSTDGKASTATPTSARQSTADVGVQANEPASSGDSTESSLVANASFDKNGQLRAEVGDISIKVSARNCDPFIETLFICDKGAKLDIVGPSGKIKQTLRLPALYLNTLATVYRGPADGSYWKDGYSIIVADLNNDSREDLAIETGKQGSYGGPSYDIYLYDPYSKVFVANRKFSELTIGRSNMFTVSKGRISASSKSGCCFHTYETYVVEKNRPKLVEIVTEDATGDGQPPVRVIKRLIDGKLRQVQE